MSNTLRRKINVRREIHIKNIDQIPDGGYVEGVKVVTEALAAYF